MDGSSFGRGFDILEYLFYISLLLWPLGIWKLIEIVIWLFQHVRIDWQ